MSYVENLLSADEQILVKQRPHWLAFIAPVINLVWTVIILIVLIQLFDVSRPPWGLAALLERYLPFRALIEPVIRDLPAWLLPGIAVLYLVLALLSFLSKELNLLSMISVITTRRVLEVQGILSKTVLDTSLEKITDILLNQSLLGRLLSYGDLSIMTASEAGFNTFRFLPKPVEFKRTMLEAKAAISGEGGSSLRSGSVGRGTISERLAELERLHHQGLISPTEFEARRQKLLDEI